MKPSPTLQQDLSLKFPTTSPTGQTDLQGDTPLTLQPEGYPDSLLSGLALTPSKELSFPLGPPHLFTLSQVASPWKLFLHSHPPTAALLCALTSSVLPLSVGSQTVPSSVGPACRSHRQSSMAVLWPAWVRKVARLCPGEEHCTIWHQLSADTPRSLSRAQSCHQAGEKEPPRRYLSGGSSFYPLKMLKLPDWFAFLFQSCDSTIT